MRCFDMIKWVWFAGILLMFWEGFQAFQSGQGERSVAFALGCSLCLLCFIKRIQKVHYLKMRMKKIDKLNGRGFEQYLAVQFRHLGYRVKLTEYSHDYGADLIVKKRRERIVVQAKRYERNVGISAVQEAVGAIAYYGANRAMVVTNSGFTKSARNLAAENNVELWGRSEIQKKFRIPS